ncbi:hypothetical protein GCM10023213_23450 [Prosthecobacter algae]|uniref:Uncharacterized protein n=1 Tax=Prosthecobacter algae TaxID=1144682 RepID=A0ABP9P7M6_9BACT
MVDDEKEAGGAAKTGFGGLERFDEGVVEKAGGVFGKVGGEFFEVGDLIEEFGDEGFFR